MDNRNRDKMSKESMGPTSAGNVNRGTSQQSGNVKSDSNASFGQNIGRSENIENEPSRRSGSMGSSSGNLGSSSGSTGSNKGSNKSSSGSSSSSSESGWQSSGGRRSNIGEQSDVSSSSESKKSSSDKSYGDRGGQH